MRSRWLLYNYLQLRWDQLWQTKELIYGLWLNISKWANYSKNLGTYSTNPLAYHSTETVYAKLSWKKVELVSIPKEGDRKIGGWNEG